MFGALDERGLSGEKENVKFWYDGFVFGNKSEIYNPWSITKYLDSKKYGTYWADTSSNALVSMLFRQGDPELKMQLEDLLEGKALEVIFDEQIIFEQLEDTPGAVFSLLMASGYLKPVSMEYLMDFRVVFSIPYVVWKFQESPGTRRLKIHEPFHERRGEGDVQYV